LRDSALRLCNLLYVTSYWYVPLTLRFFLGTAGTVPYGQTVEPDRPTTVSTFNVSMSDRTVRKLMPASLTLRDPGPAPAGSQGPGPGSNRPFSWDRTVRNLPHFVRSSTHSELKYNALIRNHTKLIFHNLQHIEFVHSLSNEPIRRLSQPILTERLTAFCRSKFLFFDVEFSSWWICVWNLKSDEYRRCFVEGLNLKLEVDIEA
jgi:hypothetical protein